MMAVAGVNTFLSGSPLSMRINPAHAPEGKTIVSVFQRGGCDGLNCVIPYNEGHYYDMRPTIAIGAPDAPTNAALDLNGQFDLHPALSGLHQLYQAGSLAILPTVHDPNGSRSHFQSQHYIESGQRQSVSDGWLNRHLQTQNSNASFRAVGFGSNLAQSLRSDETVASLTRLANYNIGLDNEEETLLLQRLSPLYQQSASSANQSLLNRFGLRVFNDLDLIGQIRSQDYQPENGAQYPNNNFGNQLREVAQLIKSGVGLEAATVDIGGWDTHSNQGTANGSQARSLTAFSQGIHAFVTDLADYMQDVVLLTSTEFSRPAHENGSRGTDHGYASTWFAIGGGIQGGLFGDWPGLSQNQLRDGRYLDATVDYRDIYAEILTHHLTHNQLASLLPDFTPQTLNLFANS
ncbi:DUF1501 domain-containing protein [Catenovulum sp. SM1970]|uniref:DUF1501 domain-containing protein n=1 Tax=Marinifaba aquimaris TaxID=2741323 RepID=UPI00157230ED|nr:DUF1501 domain-containing protein [Marinifaba aquimaris]NTS77121.1 DUF1501 domain-containing protein [Marinifaba aquimaris]